MSTFDYEVDEEILSGANERERVLLRNSKKMRLIDRAFNISDAGLLWGKKKEEEGWL